MAEITLEATRGTQKIAVARSLETPRLATAAAQIVIDSAVSKLELELALNRIESNLQDFFLTATQAGALSRAFADGASFDDGAVFSDQSVTL